MKVSRFVELLKAMPQDAYVFCLWDGGAGTEIQNVWLSRDGRVITSDYSEPCYYTRDRPIEAPTQEEDAVWETPSERKGEQ